MLTLRRKGMFSSFFVYPLDLLSVSLSLSLLYSEHHNYFMLVSFYLSNNVFLKSLHNCQRCRCGGLDVSFRYYFPMSLYHLDPSHGSTVNLSWIRFTKKELNQMWVGFYKLNLPLVLFSTFVSLTSKRPSLLPVETPDLLCTPKVFLSSTLNYPLPVWDTLHPPRRPLD